jgi:hypothetical protein
VKRQCAVVACQDSTTGWSTLCEVHKRAKRRHGHAEQTGVTAHELKPYLKRVAARRTKNAANPLWQLLRGRWEALTGHAEATLLAYASGAVAISYEQQTAQQLMTLRDTVAGDLVIDAALAMYVYGEDRPGRFKSDQAFNFQLARRVRGLARANAGSRWSEKEGREIRTQRDIPPRVLGCLAASLRVAFGVPGLKLAAMDKADVVGQLTERQQVKDAMEAMQ